jgi:hypothetical protein
MKQQLRVDYVSFDSARELAEFLEKTWYDGWRLKAIINAPESYYPGTAIIERCDRTIERADPPKEQR